MLREFMEEIFGEFLKVNTFSVPNLGQNIKKNLTLMGFLAKRN